MDKTSSGLLTRLRFLLAVAAGRFVSFLCRLCGWPGTSLPGAVALRFFPHLVSFLAPAYEKVIAVTGTNGKTTTANLLAHILRSSGLTVANNAEGANMLPGVATAMIRDCTLAGRPRSRVALLEVDEGSVGKVFPAAEPDLVLVTNYFRDQLDRYEELERTIALLRRTLDELPQPSLLLNADDPLTAAVGYGRERVSYYGMGADARHTAAGEGVFGELDEVKESGYCPRCGEALSYRCYYYGQLGDYYCPQCDFRRPELRFAAERVHRDEYLTFDLSVRPEDLDGRRPALGSAGREGRRTLQAPLRGFYNTYNVLAATAAALMCGVSFDEVKRSLLDYKTATGRMEEFVFRGRPCVLALIKNPTGANEVLKTILGTEKKKALVIAVNDLAADGRDVSWLWDAGFSVLGAPGVQRIICSGRRAGDMAVCLKYAGVPLERLVIAPEPRESLQLLGDQDAEELYVLATYTRLFDYARLLRQLGEEVEKGAPQGVPSLP